MRPAPTLARRRLLAGLVLTSLAVAGCSTDSAPGESGEDLLDAHGLQKRGARTLIEELEALPLADRPSDLLAAVLPDRLDLSDASGRQTSLSLSDEDFYVSVAPFVDTTHDCFHHSLTTCVGELQEQDLEVHVVAADGTVLVDEMRTTAPNGFLGLWLPRGQELALTLTRDGASASTQVTTTADSATCLTTMQLTD